MSTLASSSSPATSPHNAFLVKSPRVPFAPPSHLPSRSHSTPTRSPSTSSHKSQHQFSSSVSASASSPRRAISAAGSSPASQQRPDKQRTLESGVGLAGGAGYVHAGTQYSPVGSPPTSKGRSKVAGAVGKPPGSTSGGGQRKRKEVSTSGDSSPEHMSTSSASSGAPRTKHIPQPSEPQARTDPPGSASTVTTSSSESQPQEARSTHGHSAAPKKSKGEPGSVNVMPLRYETASPKDIGVLISNMLMELIRINDKIPLRDGRLTRFHSRAPPGISVSDYLQRLIQHATLSPPILLSMVYYIDRLCTLYPAFTINSLTVHRFLITAATVAAKGLSDSFWTNPTYARIGGIPVSELATLELELLQRVHWKIVPKPEALEEYYASLVDRTDGFAMESAGSASDSSISDSSEVKREDEDMADDAS